MILKASSVEVKVLWIRRMRQLIQDTYFGSSSVAASLPSLSVPLGKNRGSKSTISQRSSRCGMVWYGMVWYGMVWFYVFWELSYDIFFKKFGIDIFIS